MLIGAPPLQVPTGSPVRILSKYSRATYRMHGMSLSTPVKDTVSRVAVAVAVAVAVSRVRVHRLAAISASGRERASVPSLSVSFRVSPTLAAAEGRQSTGPYHPSWRVGRKVGKAPSSDERGSPVPGRSVANVCSSGVPLAVVCSFERKGCGSTLGQQELAVACACACPVVLVLIQVWQWQQWQQWQWHLHLCLHIHHQMYMHVHMYVRKY